MYVLCSFTFGRFWPDSRETNKTPRASNNNRRKYYIGEINEIRELLRGVCLN